MKKAMSVIALFAVLLLTVSARTERIFMATEGYRAPELTVASADSTADVSLDRLRGKYVLLNFWASTDAQSRIQAKDYDLIASGIDTEHFRHVAVNTDDNTALFREIIRRDGLKADAQHSISDAVNPGRLTDDWHLQSGLRAFLIDPAGYIVAVNPTHDTIKKLLGA